MAEEFYKKVAKNGRNSEGTLMMNMAQENPSSVYSSIRQSRVETLHYGQDGLERGGD